MFISLEKKYPQRIRRRSDLGHIFQGKSASYGPGNMIHVTSLTSHITKRQVANIFKHEQ